MHDRRRQQLVDWFVAGTVGVGLLVLSDLLVPPPAVPRPGHPADFVAIAQAPFAFAGTFPQRILWPLLAHVAGWFGIGPIVFSQACCAALLAVVFWFGRQRGVGWLGAGLVAAAVAVSGAVGVYKPLACLSDPLNLLLLVLTVHCQRRPLAFWLLVALAALSHEMVFFFAPWLLWLRWRAGGSPGRDVGALAVVLAVYAAWRLFVQAMVPPGAPVVTYDAAYYIQNNFWVPWGLPTMWGLWALVVMAEFGPLLVLVVVAWRRRPPGLVGVLGPWLYLVCVLSLMLLAYDVFRFATFVFLPVVAGGLAVVATSRGRVVVAALVAAAAATCAWQHPIPSEQGGRAFTDVSGHVRELLIARMRAAGTDAPPRFAVVDAWAFPAELLARTWPTFAVAGLGALACVAAGLWLARWIGAVPAAAALQRADQDA